MPQVQSLRGAAQLNYRAWATMLFHLSPKLDHKKDGSLEDKAQMG
jgi:hypothetical protein